MKRNKKIKEDDVLLVRHTSLLPLVPVVEKYFGRRDLLDTRLTSRASHMAAMHFNESSVANELFSDMLNSQHRAKPTVMTASQFFTSVARPCA